MSIPSIIRIVSFLLIHHQVTSFQLSTPRLLHQRPSYPPRFYHRDASSSLTRLHVFDRMSEECVNALISAQSTANKLKLTEVDSACMLVGCVDHPETRALQRTLQQYRITYRDLTATLQRRRRGAGAARAAN